jgi:hypothetical protein
MLIAAAPISFPNKASNTITSSSCSLFQSVSCSVCGPSSLVQKLIEEWTQSFSVDIPTASHQSGSTNVNIIITQK